MVYNNILEALGHTPMIKLNQMLVTVLPDTAERYFSTPLFEND